MMRTPLLLGSVALLCGCASHSVDREQPGRAAVDSAEVIRAAWTAGSAGHTNRRAAVLWMPAPTDTGTFVRISPRVQQVLRQAGVALERRRVTGDDTVLFRVTNWVDDSSGSVLELQSAWTTVLGAASRACRTGSGNIERFRVRWSDSSWTATRHGSVVHGDRECVPIPPG